MIRRLTVTAAAVLAVIGTYRSGYGNAVLFGARQWCRARPGLTDYEPDAVG